MVYTDGSLDAPCGLIYTQLGFLIASLQESSHYVCGRYDTSGQYPFICMSHSPLHSSLRLSYHISRFCIVLCCVALHCIVLYYSVGMGWMCGHSFAACRFVFCVVFVDYFVFCFVWNYFIFLRKKSKKSEAMTKTPNQ